MNLFERFFRRSPSPASSAATPSGAEESPRSLAVLFAGSPSVDPKKVTGALQTYDSAMKHATFEADPELLDKGIVFGLAGWDRHEVRIVGFDAPYPPSELTPCLQNAPFDDARKKLLADARGHVLLYYAGDEEAPLEQYVALAAVAGALCRCDALGVVNPHAVTAMPGAVFADPKMELGILRALPILAFYCSWGTFEAEDGSGRWIRTVGAHALDQPDLAAPLENTSDAVELSEIFGNILSYLCDSGAKFASGHTMQVGEDVFMRVRAPTRHESFLAGEGSVLVAEFIGEDEINP